VPSNIEPEETQAIMDLMAEGPARPEIVAERDFRRPRRLSSSVREELARVFKEIIPSLEDQLAEVLGSACPVELVGVGEASAEDLVAESDAPLVALRFDAGGQPAWIIWENLAAVTAVEKILGSKAEAAERRLSHVECRVVRDLLSRIAVASAESIGFATRNFAVAQSLETLGSWREGGKDANVHRLEIELGLQGPGEASTLRIYVSCPDLAAIEAEKAAAVELPEHLDKVEVSVAAQLAGCEVSLDQLLALEEGDVIPIDARIDDLAVVTVEGLPFARARLGQHRGHFAIRIEQLEEEPKETR
jgi:flagellar motor switch protein FliM